MRSTLSWKSIQKITEAFTLIDQSVTNNPQLGLYNVADFMNWLRRSAVDTNSLVRNHLNNWIASHIRQ